MLWGIRASKKQHYGVLEDRIYERFLHSDF
jgi:hypothetical protein